MVSSFPITVTPFVILKLYHLNTTYSISYFYAAAHIFRHNYCTNLCYQVPAISIKKIAQLMGDTEKMVLNVYNHIMEEKEDAAKVVNDTLAI